MLIVLVARAAVTKYPKLSGLNKRKVSPHSFGV